MFRIKMVIVVVIQVIIGYMFGKQSKLYEGKLDLRWSTKKQVITTISYHLLLSTFTIF